MKRSMRLNLIDRWSCTDITEVRPELSMWEQESKEGFRGRKRSMADEVSKGKLGWGAFMKKGTYKKINRLRNRRGRGGKERESQRGDKSRISWSYCQMQGAS